MSQIVQEETYGKLVLCELFTSIWLGKWDNYEKIIAQVPEELVEEIPFHEHYEREETSLWYDNYFQIPGAYFIPPYLSSYHGQSGEEQERARQDVLCLIGEYEKFQFYYPLEEDVFPDHFGSVTGFITAILKAEVEAEQKEDLELSNQLKAIQRNIYTSYMKKGIKEMLEHAKGKVNDRYFQEFLYFYSESMEEIMDLT